MYGSTHVVGARRNRVHDARQNGSPCVGPHPSMSKHSQPDKDADESSINSLWVCVDCLLPLFGAAIAGRHCHGTGCTVVRAR